MAIHYNEEKRIFQLDTDKTTYAMGLSPEGYM